MSNYHNVKKYDTDYYLEKIDWDYQLSMLIDI
jgi:hypothetical protein